MNIIEQNKEKINGILETFDRMSYYSQSKYPQIMGNYEKNSHNLLL